MKKKIVILTSTASDDPVRGAAEIKDGDTKAAVLAALADADIKLFDDQLEKVVDDIVDGRCSWLTGDLDCYCVSWAMI